MIKIIFKHLGSKLLVKYITLGILAGTLNFLFVTLINNVVNHIIENNFKYINIEYVFSFTLIIILFIWTRKVLSTSIISFSQKVFWDLRKHLLELVLNFSYSKFINQKNNIQSVLVNDIHVLTGASLSIIDFFIAVILSIACFFYLISISFPLFCITFCVVIFGVCMYYFKSESNVIQFEKTRDLETDFMQNFDSIVDGFKEIYINPKKGRYIFKNKIEKISSESYLNNVSALLGFLNNQIIGQVLFYVLVSSILVIFGISLKIKVEDSIKFVFTLLYLLGSVQTVMSLLPSLTLANISIRKLIELKQELQSITPLENNEICNNTYEFKEMVMENIEFKYDQNDEFSIGPINFRLNKGEIVFLYGANGSGKTTFINSLIGLSIPHKGSIIFDGNLITKENYSNYRSNFSVVFSDFYLFDEILGIEYINSEELNYYLKLFEIDKKVTVYENKYSTTNLSTGQRKRLALISLLLEKRPILVLDEWAADQDPYFRKKFYTEILPLLKYKGFTIVAITHDDNYYCYADKLFRMDYGKLNSHQL